MSTPSVSAHARCDQGESREIAERAHPCGREVVAPVTQEVQLVRSGRRPVPDVEAEEREARRRAPRAAGAPPRAAPSRPGRRGRVAWAEHAREPTSSSGMSRASALEDGRHLDLRERRHRQRLGRVGDLAGDLDDVAVRVEDAELALGARAASRGSSSTPSSSRSEPSSRACGRSSLDRPPDQARDRDAVPAPGREVHHRRLEPVARGEPLVLAREDPVVRGDLLARLVLLAELLDERLAVRGDRDGVLDARDRVADPDLDRAEPRVQADVPPDVRVVGDAAGALELARRRPRSPRSRGSAAAAPSAGTRRRPSAGSTRARSARRARTASSRRARAAARDAGGARSRPGSPSPGRRRRRARASRR